MANESGWTCPKCGRVFGPAVTECTACNIKITKESTIPSGNQLLVG